MTACPRSYGIAVNLPFSGIKNVQKDLHVDPLLKIAQAKEQLIWMIKKGDLILSNWSREVVGGFTQNFLETGTRTGSLPIYTYDHDDDLPDRLGNCAGGLYFRLLSTGGQFNFH
jgi:hypothetical protein